MPLRDRSGLSSQPFWHGERGRSSRRLFKTRWSLSGPLLLPFSPFLLFLLFSPSSLARSVLTSKPGLCNRFFNEVWTVIGLSPFIWFHFHWPPQTFSLLFLSCPSVFMPLHPHPFLSLARAFVRTLACTHTRTRILLTTCLLYTSPSPRDA